MGPDALASSLVNSMKINRELSDSLEGPLTYFELDTAIENTKTRTAAGPDGITNSFIKKFWWLFRNPLLKYANFCCNRGSLSQSFLTASIKLIPKKEIAHKSTIGDLSPCSTVFIKIFQKLLTIV